MTKDVKDSADKGRSTSVKATKLQKDVPMLKVVIRCLPPTLTEDEFLKQVEPLSNHDFFCFVKADSSLGQFACSRAFINFINQNDVVSFRDKWDGFPFKDTNGKEYPAVVELAPYQKVPKKLTNRKPDPRCGTIEEDADYKKFLETLNSEIEPLPSAETYLEELEAKQRAAATARVTTPLIDFLKKKRIERIKAREKAREERRQKEKERKRQREEEKRRLEKERKKKREEKERREKEKLKKEELKSDGEKKIREKEKVKEEEKKKGKDAEKDSQIKLLKKTDKDSKTEVEEKSKEHGKTVKSHERARFESDKKKPESAKSQESISKEKERHSSGRDRNNYQKPVNDRRRPSGRDGRERDREGDRYRDRGGGGGRDRYMERERDRDRDRRPSKTFSQENLSKAGKLGTKEKLEGKDSQGVDEKRADRKDERPSGKGDVKSDPGGGEKEGSKKTTQEMRKEEDKAGEKREERVKLRNKDRPDMARYQPGQRSWSNRASKKDEGSDSPRVSPASSEGEKSKVEPSKSETPSQKSPSVTSVGSDAKKTDEKRPTAAKKFETQARNNSGRYSGGREETKSKTEQRTGDRNVRGGARGYREERSMRNRQRQDDARRKAEEAKNAKGPEKEAGTPMPEKKE